MVESNSIECNSNESIEHDSEVYHIAENKERELMSKKLSKYIFFIILINL